MSLEVGEVLSELSGAFAAADSELSDACARAGVHAQMPMHCVRGVNRVHVCAWRACVCLACMVACVRKFMKNLKGVLISLP